MSSIRPICKCRCPPLKELFSGAWEKSAATDSAEPNSKEILLRLRHLFVDANSLSTPGFFRRPHFVDADILSTHIFCQRQYFVAAGIFVDTYIFVSANILSPPISVILFRLRMIICCNDCVLCIMIIINFCLNPLVPVDHCLVHNKGNVQPHSYCFIPALGCEECRATARRATGS
jgi:hypothetical protein